MRYSGSQTIKNTPDVGVGGPASGPCNGFSGGVGVSVPGFAIGANASTVDKGCEARETARIAAMLGRMDIANAVLEHIGVVEEALKAKAERDAAKQAAMAAPAAPARVAPAAQQQQQQQKQPTPSEMELETARLAEQQKLAVAALQRKATMEKVNDTITFTNAANQEKSAQQTMAEEAMQKQAELAASIAKQQELERQILAAKSAQADKPPTSPAPEAAPNAVAAAPAPAPAAAPAPASVASAPTATVAGVAAPIPAKPPQSSTPDNPQVARSPANVDTTTNGAPAITTTSSVTGARPIITADNASSLLGLTNTASSIGSAPASAPSASDDGTRKIAMKAAVAPADAKRDASPDKGGSNAATKKSAAPDPVNAAKALLNLK